ncbi:integral membrane protein [Gaeumannomyces tritici R3-111a-1]|uniref:Integral membrane protein n=1 Tax=Gaeumannomyces tritici (strain R3-111a-1) TaxID=644352 RepID=J3NML3_GAET3|nr:integral membrane protein [Gaeumannomyces tritici R3-111a-1]EJT82546.1 integral membrane protein [Gaeumannomyces tritici R3-111a-1]
MNAGATLRASIIRTSMVPVPFDRARSDAWSNDVEGLPRGTARTDARSAEKEGGSDIDIDDGERQRVIGILQYLEYKTKCEWERERGAASATIDDTDSIYNPKGEVLQIDVEASATGRISRMFTIFPYRDANWIVSIAFILGSTSFTVNAFLGMLPVWYDPTTLGPEIATATVATLDGGAALFVTAGMLAIISALNADRGTLEAPKTNKEGVVVFKYRPALLGSPSWSWAPPAAQCAAIASTLPFQTGAFQMLGGIILSTSAVASFPGVLNPQENFFLFQMLVFLPLIIGGSMFFLANITLMIYTQDAWYKPKPASADWLGLFWSMVASTGFALTGILLMMGDSSGAAYASLYGSLLFLWGSITQLYCLMEFHPTGWAA